MKKYMLYIVFGFLGIHVILSCIMYSMQNHFELHYQQKSSYLEALKFSFPVDKDGYTWLVEGDGENIHVNFQGKMSPESNQTYFNEGLHLRMKVDPSLIEANKEKAICNLANDGKEYCNLHFDAMEIQGELYQKGRMTYKAQRPFIEVKGNIVDTITIRAKDEDKPLRVNVYAPSKEFDQDEIEVDCNPRFVPESLIEAVENPVISYSNGLYSSFQAVNGYYVYTTDKSLIRAIPSLYDISSDLSGVYKIDEEDAKKIFSFDPLQEAYTLIDEIDGHLLFLKKDKEENVSLVSYDALGNVIDTYPLEHKEATHYYNVDDQLLMINDLRSNRVAIYEYRDQSITKIDEFTKSKDPFPETARYTYEKYHDGKIYQIFMHDDNKAMDVAIYDQDTLIHQNLITGSMLADMNHFAQSSDVKRNTWENMMYTRYTNDTIGNVTFHMETDE